MKKILLTILLTCFSLHCAHAYIPSKHVIPEENKIKYFQDQYWWLRKHSDLKWFSNYFYKELTSDKLFSGVYYRFQNGRLVMFDYTPKKSAGYSELYAYLKSMGKIRKFQGIPYVLDSGYYYGKDKKGNKVKIKVDMAALLLSNKKMSRVVFVPKAYIYDKYKGSLLEKHIKNFYQVCK